jgi:hypothetical protein
LGIAGNLIHIKNFPLFIEQAVILGREFVDVMKVMP